MSEGAIADATPQWNQLESNQYERPASRRVARMITISKCIGALFLVVILCCWCNPFQGGESAHIVSHDVMISLDGSQFSYGPDPLFAFAGQTLTISCDSTIEHGTLAIYVWRHDFIPPTQAAPPLSKLSIDANSPMAKFDIPIDRTGFYRIDIWPMRERNRYDIRYDASWCVH
jgi:hypothetical protein